MSLKSILIELASEGAIKIDDADQQAYVTFLINKAAKELYDSYELIGSLREQVMNVDVESGTNQITLPSYVGQLRAVRYYQPNSQINLIDMRPRYQPKFWQSKNMLGWRMKEKVALARDIFNASLLTITFLQPCEKAIDVTIIGKTPYSDKFSETLSFAAGDSSKTSVQSFSEVQTISKSEPCLYDALITDVDGQEMGRLFNEQKLSQYQLVSIFNSPNALTQIIPVTSFVEILWKERFEPFINLQDEFLGGIYDQCIIWKYYEHKALKSPVDGLASNSASDAQAALALSIKCADQIEKIAKDVEQVQDKVMNFAPSKYLEAFTNIGRYSRNNRGWYPSGSSCFGQS